MARRISTLAPEVTYYPTVNGHADSAADTDPFVVVLRPLSGTQLRALERDGLGVIDLDPKRAGQVNFLERAFSVMQAVFETNVISVRGYSVVTRDGVVITPKNGRELWSVIMRDDVPASELAVIDDIDRALRRGSTLEGIGTSPGESQPQLEPS